MPVICWHTFTYLKLDFGYDFGKKKTVLAGGWESEESWKRQQLTAAKEKGERESSLPIMEAVMDSFFS